MLIGVPLAVICGIAALTCLTLFTYIPPQAVFQQLYQGAEYDLLQAVVFFIAAGSVMTHGNLASRLVKIGQALVGGVTGGLAITSVLICMFFADSFRFFAGHCCCDRHHYDPGSDQKRL